MVLIGLLLGLSGVELVARKQLGIGGGWYDQEETRASLLEKRGRVDTALPMPGEKTKTNYQAAAKLVIHPYLGFDSPQSRKQTTQDLKRYSKSDPERVRVILLGGSVAGIFGRLGGDSMVELLEASPILGGKKVDLMQYGRGGFKQPQHLMRVVEMLSYGIKPDLVINLDGFNEAALGANNVVKKVYPGFPPYAHWLPLVHSSQNRAEVLDAYADVRRASSAYTAALDAWLGSSLSWSGIYTFLAKRKIARLQHMQGARRADYFDMLEQSELEPSLLGPRFEGNNQEASLLAARIWLNSSIQLDKLCKANRIEYVHVLQPTLYDKGAKPISDAEREKCPLPSHWEVGVFQCYPMLREGGKQLLKRGIDFYDGSRVFAEIEQPLYYDACHFGKEGNLILAEFIAAAVLESLAK